MRERCCCGAELQMDYPPNATAPHGVNDQWALWRTQHQDCLSLWKAYYRALEHELRTRS